MVKNTEAPVKNYKIVTDANQKTLFINYEGYAIVPSIEDKPFCMSQVINLLMDLGAVTKVVFKQREDFVYDGAQAEILSELAQFIRDIIERDHVLDIGSMNNCSVCSSSRQSFMNVFLMSELREDPIGAYIHLIEHIQKEKAAKTKCHSCNQTNESFAKVLEKIFAKMTRLKLIKQALPFLKGYTPDNREVYHRIFHPDIKPSFLYTKIAKALPVAAKELASYDLNGAKVLVFQNREEIRPVYHILPIEYDLLEDEYLILGQARETLAGHKPTKSEFVDPKHTRNVFKKVGRDLLSDLFKSRGVNVTPEKIDDLSDILVRYTIGFGILELLLKDPKIQDVSINSPSAMNSITVVHSDYGECTTNITVTPRDTDSWATKFRLMSGRPLDESNPVLDAELLIPGSRSRVTIIQAPLSPSGLAFSFRRHRDRPWTLPLFVQNKMLTPLAAGLLGFMIDGGRTLLIAGTRSAGKTSLLSSLMVQILRSTRVITVEDTLELPVDELKKLDYDIQSLKVKSVITGGDQEIGAAEGIRTSLRMGDSSLIVGEVRSTEALALYEAMRVGALANVVAGTIHGDSPYGVFDRVVNDLKVPPTSFKATDIIVVCNPIKSASGLQSERRVVQITEVRKNWDTDPLKENGFVDLMVYNPKTDLLEPTDALLQGESEILKSIASRVRSWAGDYDAIWQNIELRAKMVQTIVDAAAAEQKPALLESDFLVMANDEFHRIMEDLGDDAKLIYSEWLAWFKTKGSSIE
jgi:archaeal flagellar protein FlaI